MPGYIDKRSMRCSIYNHLILKWEFEFSVEITTIISVYLSNSLALDSLI